MGILTNKNESKGMDSEGTHCARPHEFELQEPKGVRVSGREFNGGGIGHKLQEPSGAPASP